MPLNSTSKESPPPYVLMERCIRRPWEAYVEPLKMAPGVWYISGNDWVACYLLETTDGLILIDTAMHENLYLMLENIRKIGYKPTDIKKFLLSHAHIDHIGAARSLKELTGATHTWANATWNSFTSAMTLSAVTFPAIPVVCSSRMSCTATTSPSHSEISRYIRYLLQVTPRMYVFLFRCCRQIG